MEFELRGLHIEDGSTQNITRHEVGSELNTAKTCINQS